MLGLADGAAIHGDGTDLGAQEWRDTLVLRYDLDPPDFTKCCYSCNTKFTIFHVLVCKRGDLFTARYNKVQDGVADLANKAFPPSYVHDDPLIFAGCALKRPKAKPARTRGSCDKDSVPPP